MPILRGFDFSTKTPVSVENQDTAIAPFCPLSPQKNAGEASSALRRFFV